MKYIHLCISILTVCVSFDRPKTYWIAKWKLPTIKIQWRIYASWIRFATVHPIRHPNSSMVSYWLISLLNLIEGKTAQPYQYLFYLICLQGRFMLPKVDVLLPGVILWTLMLLFDWSALRKGSITCFAREITHTFFTCQLAEKNQEEETKLIFLHPTKQALGEWPYQIKRFLVCREIRVTDGRLLSSRSFYAGDYKGQVDKCGTRRR